MESTAGSGHSIHWNQPASSSRLSFIFPSWTSICMMMVACGRLRRPARRTPVWPKPWSSLWRPVKTKSAFSFWMAAASARAEPSGSSAKNLSSATWMPRSAPLASASLIVCLTRSGPIESATTSPPCFSLSRSASSSAKLSGSFISKPMSASRIQFLAICRGASFAGTCLMQTIMFKKPSQKQGNSAAFPAAEDQGGVSAAEAEGIREHIFDRSFARDVGDVIEVADRVKIFVIDGRRQDLVVQRQDADTGFEAARAAQQVTGHGLGGAYGHLLGAVSEHTF